MKEPITEVVNTKLTISEKDAVRKLAESEGRTIANWLRQLIVAQLPKPRKKP